MTPQEIRDARDRLGLTNAQLGRMLDTDGQTVQRLQMPASASTHRRPAPRMLRLLRAYLDGYRPPDWPHNDAPDGPPRAGTDPDT